MQRGDDQPNRMNATVLTPLVTANPVTPPASRKTPSPQPPTRVALEAIRLISGDEEVRGLIEGLREGISGALARNTAIAITTGDPAGVDFVLKGSVQAVGKRLRLSFVLEEVASTTQVWAERYDRQLDDVFSLQDELVGYLASAIRTRIKMVLFERLRHADDATLTVPELLDKAAGLFHIPTLDSTHKAVTALRVAIGHAPESSMAWTMLGYGLFDIFEYDARAIPPEAADEILAAVERAVPLDPKSYVARTFRAMVVHDLRGDTNAVHTDASEALRRNANHIAARAMVAISEVHLGNVSDGLSQLKQVVAAGTDDASHSRHRRELALAHWLNGDAVEGMKVAAKLWQEHPDSKRTGVLLAALSAAAGELDEAGRHIAALQKTAPGLTLATVRLPRIVDPKARDRFTGLLTAAGL